MELSDIEPTFQTENETFECKSRLDREKTLGWLKTIDGFANSKGGVLFLGVEDKSYKLIGFSKEEIDGEKLFLFHEIKEHFDIAPSLYVEVIPYLIRGSKRFILKATIAEAEAKPLLLKYQGMPMAFIRRDGYTDSASSEEMMNLLLSSKQPSFDLAKTQEPFLSDNFKTLYAFYEQNTGKALKEKELASIGFFDQSGNLAQGAKLFEDDYDGGRTKIVCSVYKGNTRGDDEILSSISYEGNLVEDYRFAWDFVNQKMNRGFIKEGTRRIDYDAFPQRSLFEAIINALTHRDYLIRGSAIFIDLFRDRLVISSPGSLLGTLGEVKQTYRLDSFISRRRNELISDVFILCKAMEAKGTGLEKISDDYKDASPSQKPYIFCKNNQFSIVLPDLTVKEGVAQSEESLFLLSPITDSTKHDIQILSYCYQAPRSVKEITDEIGVSNSTFFRKNVLGNLLKQSYLLEKKDGNKKLYLTNTEKVERR